MEKQIEDAINMELKGKEIKLNSEIALLHKEIEKHEQSLKQAIR